MGLKFLSLNPLPVEKQKQKSKRPGLIMYFHLRNLALLGLATLLILFLISPFDLPAGLYAREHATKFLASFFNHNMYEHQRFGMADIVVIFLLGSLGFYSASFFSWGAKFKTIRNYSGFIITVGFTVAVSTVHAWKWAFSRVRPYDVFPDHLGNFTHWFIPGAYTLKVGFNQGSFPSGHVATMSVLIALFFLLPSNGKWTGLRWIYFILVVIVALLMGWYRMMDGSHWLTDNVASIMLSIMISYFFYHFLFFPDMETRQRYPLFDRLEQRRPAWAINLVWQLLCWSFSLATIFVGLRIALMQDKLLHGGTVVILGIALSYLFGLLTWRGLFPVKRKRIDSATLV
jgi:membrane-associated phospholipid phosphatase